MRVVVTGGAGYIGSHVVRTLIERGHDAVVIDDLSTGRASSVARVPLVVADCGDPVAVDAVLSEHRPEAVMHFAALKSVEESVADPARYFAHNVGKTATLVGAIDRAKVGTFVFS